MSGELTPKVFEGEVLGVFRADDGTWGSNSIVCRRTCWSNSLGIRGEEASFRVGMEHADERHLTMKYCEDGLEAREVVLPVYIPS